MGVGVPPLSLYVHIPWCVRKCPYCDFNSYRAPEALPEGRYLSALLRDLEVEATRVPDRPLTSIFFGGGTPSLFSGAAIAALLKGIERTLPLGRCLEVTLEANPGAVDAERFAEYRRAGVNRLSIGVQSFRDRMLDRLGRVHDRRDAGRAFASARAAGFDDINLDLMYGLPGDTPDGALEDLEQALELGPAHISWYQLTLEPGTAFARRPPRLPSDEEIVAVEEAGRARLAAAGYVRYEVSAYARDGRQCRHNSNYWAFGDYLGIGAGAHGKLTLDDRSIIRTAKQRNPNTYVDTVGQASAAQIERIDSRPQIALEYLMNALRLVVGTPTDEFERRTGQSRDAIAAPRREAERRDWMRTDPARLVATPAGLQRLNGLLMLFC